MPMFNRNPSHSEITTAPPPAPPFSGTTVENTHPQEKKLQADSSRAEMGVVAPERDSDADAASGGFDPKARNGEEGVTIDAVWGRIDANGPNYRNLGWIRASVLEIKTQIGLGVLGLPLVLDTIGFLPGCLVIVAIAIIITWSDYVIGVFKLNHPEVYTLADAGYIMFGPVGREVIGFAFWLEQVAIAGAGLLSFSVALNAITGNATCTVVFVVVGAIINFGFSSIQTLDRISWIGWVGLVSIMASIITLAVSVGVGGRPAAAPQEGPFEIITHVTRETSFVDAINAVSVVVLAYAGTPNFLNIVGEMRDQRNYTKSVITCQTFVTAVYLVIGCIVYHFTGQYIASPALGSAGILMKKICYGLAIPGLLVGCILYTHMPAKYIFVRILGKSRHLSENTPTHYIVWFSCVLFNCVISFLIAEAIPFFNDLVGLIGALLGTFICIQTESYMWMWDNWRAPRTTYWWITMVSSAIFFFLGWFLMIAGTYGSVVTINNSLNSGSTVSPFSCADNSGS